LQNDLNNREHQITLFLALELTKTSSQSHYTQAQVGKLVELATIRPRTVTTQAIKRLKKEMHRGLLEVENEVTLPLQVLIRLRLARINTIPKLVKVPNFTLGLNWITNHLSVRNKRRLVVILALVPIIQTSTRQLYQTVFTRLNHVQSLRKLTDHQALVHTQLKTPR
jgi:hypothetical protein